MWFADSDLYKTAEAAAWETASRGAAPPALREFRESIILGRQNVERHHGELAQAYRLAGPLAIAEALEQPAGTSRSELLADAVTGAIPSASVTGVKLTRRRMHFDASRSLSELGLTPRPSCESIADAVAWFREVKWLR